MPRKTEPSTTPERRTYTDEFKRDAVAMLVDGHSASSIAKRLGISGANLLYRWRKQQIESAGPVGEVLDGRVAQLEAELRRVERERDVLKNDKLGDTILCQLIRI